MLPLILATGILSLSLPSSINAQSVISDPGIAGPRVEIVHLYYDQFPTGITVARNGRKFSNYPPGLDANNTNTPQNGKYTVAEIFSNNTERAYPSLEFNSPPGGSVNYSTVPPTGAASAQHLTGVQSVVLDPLDRLWILDTGRALSTDGTLVPAVEGGPKLVCVSLATNTVIQTIIFPRTVAYPVSYLNDVRFDLRPNLSGTSGKGVAYITDSSAEGRNGIIVADLGTGKSWRHLDGIKEVHPDRGFVPFVWGTPLYSIPSPGQPLTTVPMGADGIALSADGKDLYWGSVGGRQLYSISTALLRDNGTFSELAAQAGVRDRGQRGVSDGFETDTNGLIFMGNMEQEGINFYDPRTSLVSVFVRDPRINWVDTMSVGSDGYIYFTVNQLSFTSSYYPGTDRRTRPFALMRAKLPGNGTRTNLQ